MLAHGVLLAITIGAGAAAQVAAQDAPARAENGTAVVRFVIEPPTTLGTVRFRGTPAGVTTGGGSLIAADLRPGRYASTLADLGPELRLTSIDCDDQSSDDPSQVDVSARTVTFRLGAGEMVSCVFTVSPRTPVREERSREASVPTGTNPFRSRDHLLDNFPVPDVLPPDAGTVQVPRTGLWNGASPEGRMVCLGAVIPLDPSRAAGIIEVLPDGRTLRGTGFGYMEPLVMVPDPAVAGRYVGSTNGFQDRIPVTITLHWQLVTDEWIIGFMQSPATNGACSMNQMFQLRYSEGR